MAVRHHVGSSFTMRSARAGARMLFVVALVVRSCVGSLEGIRARGLELLDPTGMGWTGPGIEMMDHEGKRYSCSAERKSRAVAKDVTRESLLAGLEGLCSKLNQGWWTYEWCHRSKVRQFHAEASTAAADPDWSLGSYSSSVVMESKNKNRSAYEEVALAVDIFDVGGQRCDETDAGRKSLVTFSCCRDRASGMRRKKDERVISPKKVAYLLSVEETALCEYGLSVCSPLLCETTTAATTNVAALLKPLEGICVQKTEGWWTFEFCYKKQARQFHAEVVRDEKSGKKALAPVADFNLGNYQGNDDLVAQKPTRDGPDRKAKVELEYDQGTACDVLKNQRRATTVRLVCGNKHALTNVFEDQTCHYTFTVTTPTICAHPIFSAIPRTRKVTCDPIAENDEPTDTCDNDDSCDAQPPERQAEQAETRRRIDDPAYDPLAPWDDGLYWDALYYDL